MERLTKPVNVVCFYWQKSDRPGWMDAELGKRYIINFYNAVKRNTTIDFNFICLTTLDPFCDDFEFKKLEVPSWKGCLPKFAMFNPELGLEGRVFACDLDVFVVGNMDELFSYDGYFATRSAFKGPKLSGGDMVGFEGGDLEWIWKMFNDHTERVEKRTGGRERFLYRDFLHDKMDFFQDIYPDQIISYKAHIMKKKLKQIPTNARLISCHGFPRPHQITDEWAELNWR